MKLFSILIASLIFELTQAQTDTLWFDKDWKNASRDNAAFFRPPLKHEGERYYLIDYYINGNKQMESWAFDTEGKELDGEAIYYYSNGKMKSDLFFANKKGNGTWKEYFEDGTLRGIRPMVNGLGEGKVYYYRPNGLLNAICDYAHGKRNGESRVYDGDGHLSRTYMYLNDSLDGEGRVYFEDSSLRAVVHYTNNKSNGEWLEYYPNHQLRGKVNYKNGTLEGPWLEYYDNGRLKGTTQYKNGKPDGELTAYKISGKLDFRDLYSNGVKNGRHEAWYTNGRLMEEGTYTNDEKSGEWKTYSEAGKVILTVPSNYAAKITAYRKNELKILSDNTAHADGEAEQKYSNGKTQSRGSYYQGKKAGEWRYYNKQGDIVLRENYDEGKLYGVQTYYNSYGTIIKEVPFKEDQLHGMVVEFDDSGHANLNLFFKNGHEFYDAKEFYAKFYSEGVTTTGNVQIINMDQLKDAGTEAPQKTEAIELREEGPMDEQVKMDTVSYTNGIAKLTTTVTRADFNSESKAIDKITVNMVITLDGEYILTEHKNYKAADNELMFFVEDNTGDISGQELGFRVGKNVKTALRNGSLRISEVIKFFSYRVFEKKFFSGLEAGEALEREVKN